MVPYFLRFYGALKSAQKLTDFSKYHIDCISKGDVGLFYLVFLSGCARGHEAGQRRKDGDLHQRRYETLKGKYKGKTNQEQPVTIE